MGRIVLVTGQPSDVAGKAGDELWAGLGRFCAIGRDDVQVMHIVKSCAGKTPKPAEVSAVVPAFLDELEAVSPHMVVAAGSLATKFFLGDRPLSDVHGIYHVAQVCGQLYNVLPTYSPAAGLANKGTLAAFAYDLKALATLLHGKVNAWAPGAPAYTDWMRRPPTAAWLHTMQHAIIAIDTEGWKDLPWGLSFSCDGIRGYVIRADDAISLQWFANWIVGHTLVLHNGLHDVPVLSEMGIRISDYHDTQVLAYHDMIRTGSGILEAESQNLGTLAYRECRLILGELSSYPGVDLASRVIPYSDLIMRYAAMDPIATWRLYRTYKQRGLVESQPYIIDMGQVALVAEMIDNGIPFDESATMDYYQTVLGKLDAVTADLKERAARFGLRDFNPGSHPQVRELVTRRIGLKIRKRTRGGKASTNEKALADHQDHPFVQKLQEHRELMKLRGTYIVPLLESLQ